MVLSPDARVLSGGQIQQNGTANRDIIALFQATRTVGIGPEELLFPDPSVISVFPGFGQAAFLVNAGGTDIWTAPFDVRLSAEVVVLPFRRVNLVAVALVPANGCQMDVTTDRTG